MKDPGSSFEREKAPLKALLVIGTLAFVVRSLVGIRFNLDASGDTVRGYQFYVEMARNLLDGNGLSWDFYLGMGPKLANRPPIYPTLIAIVIWAGVFPAGLVVVQAFLGGLNAVLTGLVALHFGGRKAAVIAAIVAFVYPYSVLADTSLIEHSTLTTSVLLIALAHLRVTRTGGIWSAVALGVLIAASIMVRVTVVVCVPFLALTVWLGLGGRRGFLRALAMVFGVTLVLVPWIIRNHEVVGAPVLASDTGRALWVAHNDYTLEIYPDQSIDKVEHAAYAALPAEAKARIRALKPYELAQSAYFRELALDYIRANPVRVIKGIVIKAWAFFTPVLNPPTEGPAWKALTYTVSYVPVFLAGIAGLVLLRRRWREWLFILALFAGFLGSAVLTWGQSRYRIPLDPLLMAIGSVFIVAIFRRFGRPIAP